MLVWKLAGIPSIINGIVALRMGVEKIPSLSILVPVEILAYGAEARGRNCSTTVFGGIFLRNNSGHTGQRRKMNAIEGQHGIEPKTIEEQFRGWRHPGGIPAASRQDAGGIWAQKFGDLELLKRGTMEEQFPSGGNRELSVNIECMELNKKFN